MTIRKFYTFRVNDSTPDDHTGRLGEITYRDGFLYYHDGSTPGGEIIGGGGSGGGPTSWSSITGKPSFATVATSGSYADLTGKPTIPSLDGYATESWVNSLGFTSADTGNFTFTNNTITTANGQDDIVLSIQGYDATQPTPNLVDFSWTFDTRGGLTLPSNLFFEHAYFTAEDGEQIFAGNTNKDFRLRTVNDSVPGINDWIFGTDGKLTTPSGLTISNQNSANTSTIQSDWNKNLEIQTIGTGHSTFGWQSFEGDLNFITLNYNQSKNIMITTGNAVGDGISHNWIFASNGNIQLPSGGDIVDSAGNSVLGGGGGGNPFDQSLNTDDIVTFDLLTVTDSAGIKNFNGERITNTYVDGKMYVGGSATQTPVSILMGGAGPRNEWAFTPDGLLTFPRNQDQVTTTDPVLTIEGGATPTIASTDSSLMGPANLAIQVNDLNISGYNGAKVTIHADSGSIIADNDLVLQSNNTGSANTWAFKADGSFAINNNEVHIATNNWGIGAQPNATTVVYTAKQENLASIRVHATIEGNEDGDTTGYHSQACDMMIVRRVAIGGATTVDSVVYGVIYTGAGPLATLDAQWNATTNRIEITATPTSTANNVYVKIYATEVARGD